MIVDVSLIPFTTWGLRQMTVIVTVFALCHHFTRRISRRSLTVPPSKRTKINICHVVLRQPPHIFQPPVSAIVAFRCCVTYHNAEHSQDFTSAVKMFRRTGYAGLPRFVHFPMHRFTFRTSPRIRDRKPVFPPGASADCGRVDVPHGCRHKQAGHVFIQYMISSLP